MPVLAPDSDEAKKIDAALSEWRQGDLALDEALFVHVADGAAPLSSAAESIEGDDIQAVTSETAGLVVVTQTCDIVRKCTERPYVEVAPLVKVSAEHLREVQRGRRPAYATLPALNEACLVADLDRVMTVEKAIVAAWKRTAGFASDADGRAFAQALARKRMRFAFPDDFTRMARKLQARLAEKHDKSSDEGHGLRSLREVRVQAGPSWDAATVSLFFWFVRHDHDVHFDAKSWAELLKEWLKLVPASGRFQPIEGQVVALDDMTAAEYVDSDPLDLDYLSLRAGK